MINENSIQETISKLFENLKFKSTPEGLYDPLRHMIEMGGKRLRPTLCLTCYSLFKDELTPGILRAAEAIEIQHNFTLIHDDVIDNAPMRRSSPTVWKKWDLNTAILSGDAMCIDSFARLSELDPKVLPSALKLFSSTAAQIQEGQQLDLEFEEREDVSLDEYLQMVGLKTSALLACSAAMGGVVAGASENEWRSLYAYAWNLGLAFQIADDYLDSFGNAEVFGKAIGGDILNGKKTWLLLKAMEKEPAQVRGILAMPAESATEQDAKIQAMKGLYLKLGIDSAARAEVIRYNELAVSETDSLKLSAVKREMLNRLANKLVGRVK